MRLRAVVALLGGIAFLAAFVAWLDARIETRVDQRVEEAMEAAVRAIIEAQQEEIVRTRAATIEALERAAREEEGTSR